MEVEAFQRLDPENFYRRFIKNGVRPDGRELRTVRPVSVDVDVLSEKHVQGSALVGLGSTKALAGITLEVGHPGESTPLQGALGEEMSLPLTAGSMGRRMMNLVYLVDIAFPAQNLGNCAAPAKVRPLDRLTGPLHEQIFTPQHLF